MAYKRSLNKEYRRKELLKITMENHAILKRLQDKQPTYSAARWEDEYKDKLSLFNLVCEYPFQLQHDKSFIRAQTGVPDYLSDASGLPRIGTSHSTNRHAKQAFTSGGALDKSVNRTLIRQADCLDENRIVLYKKGK